LYHKLVSFYNRDEKCLQRGPDWVFNTLWTGEADLCLYIITVQDG